MKRIWNGKVSGEIPPEKNWWLSQFSPGEITAFYFVEFLGAQFMRPSSSVSTRFLVEGESGSHRFNGNSTNFLYDGMTNQEILMYWWYWTHIFLLLDWVNIDTNNNEAMKGVGCNGKKNETWLHLNMVNILLNGENVCNYNPLELQLFGYRILSQMCEKKCVCIYIYIYIGFI